MPKTLFLLSYFRHIDIYLKLRYSVLKGEVQCTITILFVLSIRDNDSGLFSELINNNSKIKLMKISKFEGG